jgi:predicted glycogen debranching enzyme
MSGSRLSEAPWPTLAVRGELENAEREWLHTNGAGAYAMSTVALMHSRRYHGLLVAALDPPLRRTVIVSHAETIVTVGQREFRLATHQFPDVAPTPGYRLLQSFAQDPIPRWTLRLGSVPLERRLCLVRGHNATVLSYTWHGRHRVRMQLRPLFALRPIHKVVLEHGGMIHRVSMRQGEVELQPVPELPPVVFRHSGFFMGSPDWWRRFEYPVDRERGVNYQEDLWTAGTFEFELEPGKPSYLLFGVGPLPSLTPAECMDQVCQRLERLDPGQEHSPERRALTIAADAFRADEAERPAVIAGYPWLDVATRDTLIALPGLYLGDGRERAAKRVLATLLAARSGPFLPRGFGENGQVSDAPGADVSLWLFETTAELVRQVGPHDPFVRQELFPFLTSLFEAVRSSAQEVLWLTPDGLVANGGPSTRLRPLTWMDSRADGNPVTLRAGLAVELQGLWARSCSLLVELARAYEMPALAAQAASALQALRSAFARHFWCADTRYPYDCIALDADARPGFADARVRPNALIALALAPELFEHWQAASVVDVAREQLLTPLGVRTLSPNHADYRGDFRGPMAQRYVAYHQGSIWPHLLGAYARAAFRLRPNDFELQLELRAAVQQILSSGPVLGQVAQVASGSAPHGLGGCPAQAWSVAELLRMVRDHLDV